MRCLYLWITIAFLTVHLPGYAADLSKIDRTIGKEPVFQAKPKYCLVVFGPEAKTRVWLVLDGDVLYVDRNGNGDLTEKGEQVAREAKSEKPDFRLGTITLPNSKGKYDVTVETAQKDGKWGIRFLRSTPIGSPGHSHCSHGFILFADRPRDAAILHLNGPLTLTLMGWDGDLSRNRFARKPAWENQNRLSILIGTPVIGLEEKAFVTLDVELSSVHGQDLPSVDCIFSPQNPKDKPIQIKASVRYCECHRRYWASVRVPLETGKGHANIRLSFPAWKEGNVKPATFEVPID